MNSDIVRLREETGAGVMDAKRALDDAKGDYAAAVKLIAERGLVKADKKQERATSAGLLETYVHNNRVGVLLDIRCETDFVARTEAFKELAHSVAMHISAMDPESVEALLKQSFVRDESETVEELVKQTIAKTGENIKIERFTRYEL